MKKNSERKNGLVVFAACMLIAGAAASLGWLKYTFQVAGVHVAVYPAAFIALVGLVQLMGGYIPSKKKQ